MALVSDNDDKFAAAVTAGMDAQYIPVRADLARARAAQAEQAREYNSQQAEADASLARSKAEQAAFLRSIGASSKK